VHLESLCRRAAAFANEIVKVAADLESTGLFDAADLHGLEAGRSDPLFELPVGALVVRGVEEDGRLR